MGDMFQTVIEAVGGQTLTIVLVAAMLLTTLLVDRARRDPNVIDLVREWLRRRHEKEIAVVDEEKKVKPEEKRKRVWQALKDWLV